MQIKRTSLFYHIRAEKWIDFEGKHAVDLEELEYFIYEDLPDLYRGQLDPEQRLCAVIKEKSGEYSVEYSSAYDFAVDKFNAIMFNLYSGGSAA